MRIAFVTTFDLRDALKRSEMWRNPYLISYYVALSLAKYAHVEFINVSPPKSASIRLLRYKRLLYHKLFHKHYLLNREPLILKDYGRQIASQLSSLNVDIVFSSGTIPIAYLECSTPIVFWTDATFAGMLDFYPGFFNLWRTSINHGNAMEKSALQRSARAIYTSEWAAGTAVSHYNTDLAKIKIVPRGPIIETPLSLADVKSALQSRSLNKCKLLFIGNDWIRKGGDVALAVAQRLNQQGLETELTVIGRIPATIENTFPSYVRSLNFISKATKQGRETINRLLAESHFLLIPSRAETFGITYCEASAHGVPSIAADVGGVRTAIRDDINGKLFPLDADIQEYCNYITNLMVSRSQYENLALSAFNEYETRLNWTVIGQQLQAILAELVPGVVRTSKCPSSIIQ